MDPLAVILVAVPIAMIVLVSAWGGRPFWRLVAGRANWVSGILYAVLSVALWQLRLSFELQTLIVVATVLVILIWNRKRTHAT